MSWRKANAVAALNVAGQPTVHVRESKIEGVQHLVMDNGIKALHEWSDLHAGMLHQFFSRQIADFQPELVLTYGGSNYNRLVLHDAKAMGAKTAFYLAHPSYRSAAMFGPVDLFISVSRQLLTRVALPSRSTVLPILPLVDPNGWVAPKGGAHDHILFVNPEPAKGLSVFAALAVEAASQYPDWRFLVVESRGLWQHALALEPGLAACKNIEVVPAQRDMQAVYARTRLVLFPSLWWEPSGRVPLEASVYGLPTIASAHAGPAEHLADSGTLISVREALQADFRARPNKDDIQPWMAVLESLMEDPQAYAAAQQRCAALAAKLSPSAVAHAVEQALLALSCPN